MARDSSGRFVRAEVKATRRGHGLAGGPFNASDVNPTPLHRGVAPDLPSDCEAVRSALGTNMDGVSFDRDAYWVEADPMTGPIPDDLTLRTRRDRERISRNIAWIATGFVVLTFAAGLIR